MIFKPNPVAFLLVTMTTILSPAAALDASSLDLRVTDADIRPAVTLKQFDNRRVEEYSVNNNVYMLKITPSAGAPYYLIDQDGSGDMSWSRGPPGPNLQVPQWTLFRW
ncbi:hypothetical protein Thiowin_03972 [Thiorhodovibrio winogradskyi]|uniref:DUF2782 domain-containing protein n=1 Tax=Thiorhodovibrio winogradskyi TaxID=77007 RepID=A0ABZ0SFN3_9GAMM|nr:DUF2782 domain-containing protein [Thiorhodovibrio winogradskyi]